MELRADIRAGLTAELGGDPEDYPVDHYFASTDDKEDGSEAVLDDVD